jgi:hypothetical protein
MEITYEVYVRKGGRWTLEARYNTDQKDAAISEAKQLNGMPHLEAVKVVRETYENQNNRIRGKIVYTPEGSVEKKRSFDPASSKGGGEAAAEPVVYDIPGYDFGDFDDDRPSVAPSVKIPGRGVAVAAPLAAVCGAARRSSSTSSLSSRW